MAQSTALQTSYTFSFMRRGKSKPAEGSEKPSEEGKDAAKTDATASKGSGANPYETSIKQMATVTTVEEFWEIYNFLKRPSDLPTTTDYHFFRGGIKPTWEDQSNAKGGKWILRLPKGLASRYWEEVLLSIIGGQFHGVPDGEVCGAVLSIRYSEDILGVWNRSATNRDAIDRIHSCIKKHLQLPSNVHMEYKPHQASLQDRSSFRNTAAWKPRSSQESGGNRRGSSSWSDRNNDRKTGGPRGSSSGGSGGDRGDGNRGSWR